LVPDDDPVARKVFRAFVHDGRITAMPARWSKKLVLLDHVVRLFEPGMRYPEPIVNRRLRWVHDDYVALRRYLVDAGLLSRESGVYWRSGGSVDGWLGEGKEGS
jgi:hypothetical protein